MADQHGGARQGRPGVAYGARTDLNAQPIRTAPSTSYGSRAEQERIQRAAPLAGQPAMPPAMPLFRDTERAGEPLTAGLPIGPGPGPADDLTLTTRELLEALARRYPNPDLHALLRDMDA